MENALLKFRDKWTVSVLEAVEKLIGHISTRYAMEEQCDAKGECRFRRGGKTLLTISMRESGPVVLLVFGKEERDSFEMQRDQFSKAIQSRYDESRTYHDGKWVFIPLEDSSLVQDIIHLTAIKRKPDEKAITMCGYRCDLCKAYVKNVQKHDQRAELARVWEKYYGLHYAPEEILCDGCRCMKNDARRVDNHCPVRACVMSRQLVSCADCADYPCAIFDQRTGLSYQKAQEAQGAAFDGAEYEEFLLAYDNRTRLIRLIKACGQASLK